MAEDHPSPATPDAAGRDRTGVARFGRRKPGPPEGPERPPGPARQPTLGDLFWVGTACAVSVLAGGGIGYAVDDAAGTLPWFTVAGLAFGVLSAVLLAVNQFRKFV